MQRLILSRTSQRIVYKGLILFWEVTTFDSFFNFSHHLDNTAPLVICKNSAANGSAI